ncbi:MAG: SMP-30/gluconolactonase/LRE family protein, partial [Bacteroidota bacterium]
MRWIFYSLLGGLLLLIAYFSIASSPIEPVALDFPRFELTTTEEPMEVEVQLVEYCHGCEDIALSKDGRYLYAGHEDGRLLRFDLQESVAPKVLTTFSSRPLGLHLVVDSLLFVAVETDGLAKVDLVSGKVDILVSDFEEVLFMLTDDVDVATDGNVYFTDASNKYGDEDLQLDIMEGSANGAFYVYDPHTGTTERLLDDLHFANGVALAADDSFVLVNETGAFRCTKYWLRGPKTGQSEIFIEGLPGWPDGISRGPDGHFYLTLISPRTGLHDFILPRPWSRTLATKLPR